MEGNTPSLAHVLELLYTARTRYRTVRLELRSSSRPRAQGEAMQRLTGQRASQMVFAIGGGRGEIPEVIETRLRLSGEPPGRWRVERDDGNGASLTVADGDTFWTYHPLAGAMTNFGDAQHQVGSPSEATPVLDPSALLATLDLEVTGATPAGIELHGRRRPDVQGPWDSLSFGADEHLMLVHPERGVLLRVQSLYEGQELATLEVTSIEFDVELPPETFVFVPPEGVTVRDARSPHFERLTIEEAAVRASFSVFVLTGLEGDWHAGVVYLPLEEGSETLHLTYSRADGFRHVQVSESSTAVGWAAYGPVEWQESGVYRFIEEGGQSIVAFERDGTHLQLTSNELTAAELVALADGMEKAEGPPEGGPS